jgi:hypothetical protein
MVFRKPAGGFIRDKAAATGHDRKKRSEGMETNGMLLDALRRQRDLLSDLVSELEQQGTFMVEDYSYCESCTDEVSKNLKEIRRSALDKMIQGAPWFRQIAAL